MGDVDGRMKALTPLAWCDFRGVAGGQEVDSCDNFAARRVEGMPFCEGHAELIGSAIADSGVELIKDDYPSAQLTLAEERLRRKKASA